MDRAKEIKTEDSQSPAVQQAVARELTRLLGPEYVSYRKAGGPTPAPYLEGHRAIQLANEILGFDGWSSEIRERKTEYRDTKNGVQICCSCLMRVTLKNGTFREDVGYGTVQRGNNMVGDLEKAGKEAATDGLKRVLRQFGESLGNCLYDKSYMNQLKTVNAITHDLDVDDLRRPKRVQDIIKEREQERATKFPKLENSPNVSGAKATTAATTHKTPQKPAPPQAVPSPLPSKAAAAAAPAAAPVPKATSTAHTPPPKAAPGAMAASANSSAPARPAAQPAVQPAARPAAPRVVPPMLSSSPPEASPPKRPMAPPGFLSAAAIERFDKSREFAAEMSFDTSVELPVNATLRQDKTEAAKRG